MDKEPERLDRETYRNMKRDIMEGMCDKIKSEIDEDGNIYLGTYEDVPEGMEEALDDARKCLALTLKQYYEFQIIQEDDGTTFGYVPVEEGEDEEYYFYRNGKVEEGVVMRIEMKPSEAIVKFQARVANFDGGEQDGEVRETTLSFTVPYEEYPRFMFKLEDYGERI
jgi:hypothetical protein